MPRRSPDWRGDKVMRKLLVAALTLVAEAGWAGSLGVDDSTLGLQAGYNSNPLLLTSGARSAESLALVLDAPLRYTGNAQVFSLRPRLRYATTSGDVAVLSDYQYLDAGWSSETERNTWAANAGWHRDSTLYNQIESSAIPGYNLHRTEEQGSLNWQRALSERNDVSAETTVDRVTYEAQAVPTLSDYRYGAASLGLGRNLSERARISLTGGFSRYQLQDQSYRTDSTNAQLGYTAALSERWSWSAQVGKAWLKLQQGTLQYVVERLPDGTLVLVQREVQVDSSASTSNYALKIQRSYERWQLEMSATRSLQPSGLGALLTQDDFVLKASRDWTERLNLSIAARETQLSDSLGPLSSVGGPYYYLDLGASWKLTERWLLQAQVSGTRQRLSAQTQYINNFSAFVTVARQFGRQRIR
jgi:hypothetical protein